MDQKSMHKQKGVQKSRFRSSAIFTTLFWLVFLISFPYSMVPQKMLVYANDDAVWNSLKSDSHFALLRHAIAPGTGDPSNFVLDKCATQRNLSDEGRSQAVKIGDLFRENGIDRARVFSSQWCRCLETAKLLSLGPLQKLPALNSFFRKYERRELQTEMLKDWLAKQDLTKPLVLVTHQVNITALTGIYPSSGELVVVRQHNPGEFLVVGRLKIDQSGK